MRKIPLSTNNSPPLHFHFHGKVLRVFLLSQGPRFVAADIAKLLKYPNQAALLASLEENAGELLPSLTGPACLALSEQEVLAALQHSHQARAQQVHAWLLRKVLPALPMAPQQASDRLQLAYTLSGEAARQVGQAVWEKVLAQDNDWQHSRWLISVHYQYQNRQRRPWGEAIALRAEVTTLAALADCVAEAQTLPASNVDLIKLAAACHLRLAERLKKQADRDKHDCGPA